MRDEEVRFPDPRPGYGRQCGRRWRSATRRCVVFGLSQDMSRGASRHVRCEWAGWHWPKPSYVESLEPAREQ
jgi:hypothetical protein